MVRLLASTALFIVGKNMYKFIFAVSLLFVVSCTGIRDRITYNMELFYIEEGLTRQGELVREHLRNTCCQGKQFQQTTDCYAALDTYITIKERTSYHVNMMRYLGRITDERPELPKVSIEGDPVCE